MGFQPNLNTFYSHVLNLKDTDIPSGVNHSSKCLYFITCEIEYHWNLNDILDEFRYTNRQIIAQKPIVMYENLN